MRFESKRCAFANPPQVKLWTTRINLKLTAQEIKDVFSQVDKLQNGTISLPNFYELYNILMEQPTVNDEFKAFSTELAKFEFVGQRRD